jgi:hypothetical protein
MSGRCGRQTISERRKANAHRDGLCRVGVCSGGVGLRPDREAPCQGQARRTAGGTGACAGRLALVGDDGPGGSRCARSPGTSARSGSRARGTLTVRRGSAGRPGQRRRSRGAGSRRASGAPPSRRTGGGSRRVRRASQARQGSRQAQAGHQTAARRQARHARWSPRLAARRSSGGRQSPGSRQPSQHEWPTGSVNFAHRQRICVNRQDGALRRVRRNASF